MISSQINKEFIELRCLYPYLLDLNSESPRLDSNQRPVDYMKGSVVLGVTCGVRRSVVVFLIGDASC